MTARPDCPHARLVYCPPGGCERVECPAHRRQRRETVEGPTLEQDPTPRCDCGGAVTTRVHYPGRSLSACARCALTAANVALAAGWPVTLEPMVVYPQPPCQGCDAPIERCGPALWVQGRKCCPDCTHGVGAPGPEYEPSQADIDRINAVRGSKP